MDIVRIPARRLPDTGRIFTDFLGRFSRVAQFYAFAPSGEGIAESAKATQFRPIARDELVSILREQNEKFGSDSATIKSLDRLASGAVAVVTGQQVGLFGGPAYSIYKALTAAHVAGDLTRQGIAAVPVFWLATEDHDFAEVNHTFWLPRGALRTLEISSDDKKIGSPVGKIPLGNSIVPLVEEAVVSLDGPAGEEVARILRSTYQPAENFGSAFAKLLARLLAGRGIIFLDPLDPRIHRLAAPLLARAVENCEALQRELLARSKALSKAGYHPQVKVTESSAPLFLLQDGARIPLRWRNHGFAAGDRAYDLAELLKIAQSEPERLSPNALLRPVVQDFLLPSAVAVGGPAEIAYFAQSSALYRVLDTAMPAVVPRASFTVIEPHVARLLRKYGLTIEDVLKGKQSLRRKMESAYLSASLERTFSSGARQIRAQLKKLRSPLAKLDKSLLGARESAEKKMLYQFEKLRARAGRARDSRTDVLSRHESVLLDALWPHRGLQERSLCLLPFLARAGTNLLNELQTRAEPSGDHCVLVL